MRHREHLGAGLADLLGRHRERVVLDVGHHDVHALGRERVGQRPADAARRAGDDRDLAPRSFIARFLA